MAPVNSVRDLEDRALKLERNVAEQNARSEEQNARIARLEEQNARVARLEEQNAALLPAPARLEEQNAALARLDPVSLKVAAP